MNQVPHEEVQVGATEDGDFVEADFSALADFHDGVESEEEEVPEPTPPASEEEETPPPEEPEPEETPPAEEPSTDEQESEETEEPVTEPEPEPEVPEVKVPTREELEGMYEDFRKETMPNLEKLYEMDEETAQAFDENPRQVLPKIAAQVHYDVMMSTYNAVMAAMPSVVGRLAKAMDVANTAEGQFFEAWPDLKGVNPQVVSTAIQAYRSANPTADLNTVIKNAGQLAMVNAGKSLTPPSPPPPPPPPPPKPAGPGGVPPTPPKRPSSGEEDNVFSDLAGLWDNDH